MHELIHRIAVDVFGKLTHIGITGRIVEQPAHVAPPETLVGIMWITRRIGVLMVHSVDTNPGDRRPLGCQTAEDNQHILNPLGGFEAAVRNQAMKTQVDTQATT